jgi:hypothetical protein
VADAFQCLLPVGRLCQNGHILHIAEDLLQTFPDDGVIVNDQYPDYGVFILS